MKNYEIEFPGRYHQKFGTLEEMQKTAMRLVSSGTGMANVYSLDPDQNRIGLYCRIVMKEKSCPSCHKKQNMLTFQKTVNSTPSVYVCKNCGRTFSI